jgi:hypothetical protein
LNAGPRHRPGVKIIPGLVGLNAGPRHRPGMKIIPGPVGLNAEPRHRTSVKIGPGGAHPRPLGVQVAAPSQRM